MIEIMGKLLTPFGIIFLILGLLGETISFDLYLGILAVLCIPLMLAFGFGTMFKIKQLAYGAALGMFVNVLIGILSAVVASRIDIIREVNGPTVAALFSHLPIILGAIITVAGLTSLLK